MLRVRREAGLLAANLASRTASSTPRPKIDPSVEFDFQRATPKDQGRLMDIILDGFIHAEPYAVALGFTRPKATKIVEYMTAKALHYPYSVAIVERSTGKMVGFRLMSETHRDASKDFSPFDFDMEKEDEGVQILANALDSVKTHIWDLQPQAETILRREITFVAKEHQRKGIAQHLVHLYLDFEEMKARGIDGIMSEASSVANQQLLKRNGYSKLLEAERKFSTWKDGRPLVFPDETKTIHLMYRKL